MELCMRNMCSSRTMTKLPSLSKKHRACHNSVHNILSRGWKMFITHFSKYHRPVYPCYSISLRGIQGSCLLVFPLVFVSTWYFQCRIGTLVGFRAAVTMRPTWTIRLDLICSYCMGFSAFLLFSSAHNGQSPWVNHLLFTMRTADDCLHFCITLRRLVVLRRIVHEVIELSTVNDNFLWRLGLVKSSCSRLLQLKPSPVGLFQTYKSYIILCVRIK